MDISATIELHDSLPGKGRLPAEEAIGFLARAGFKVLDFSFGAYPPENGGSVKEVCAAAETAAKCGAEFRYAHLPYNFPKDFTGENVSAFNKRVFAAIDAAAAIHIRHAVIHACTGPVPAAEFCEEAEMVKAVATLAPVFEYADRAGLDVVIENMRDPVPGAGKRRYLTDIGELIRLCDALGGRGICFDTGHAHTVKQDVPESFVKMGGRLKMLHINDNFAAGDDHLPPFHGTIDWYGIMDGLRLADYKGDFNYEVNISRVPEELREDSLAYLLKAAKHLISYKENAAKRE